MLHCYHYVFIFFTVLITLFLSLFYYYLKFIFLWWSCYCISVINKFIFSKTINFQICVILLSLTVHNCVIQHSSLANDTKQYDPNHPSKFLPVAIKKVGRKVFHNLWDTKRLLREVTTRDKLVHFCYFKSIKARQTQFHDVWQSLFYALYR